MLCDLSIEILSCNFILLFSGTPKRTHLKHTKKKHIDFFLNNTLSSSSIEWIQQMVDFMFARENHLNILIIYDDQ